MQYFPIQTISAYSLLQSPVTPRDLIVDAKNKGYKAIALTDYNVLYGVTSFYNAAKFVGIKPIIGLTIELTGLVNTNTDEKLILLAKNQAGYQNLMKISSYKMQTTTKLTATLNNVLNNLKNLFVIIPMYGEMVQLLQQGDEEAAKDYLATLRNNIDDNQSLLLGISLNYSNVFRNKLIAFANDNDLKLVVNEKVNYLKKTDLFATKVLQAIDANITLSNIGKIKNETGEFFLKQPTDVEQAYQMAGLGDALDNLTTIYEKCQLDLIFKKPQLPTYQPFNKQQGLTSIELLRKIAKQGLQDRRLITTVYQQRLADEIAVIERLQFADYFLIVWDILNWTHQQNIQTGPGRGSAAGSLVAYALKITDVDPLKYDLLFERFLNEQRAQMPDIDIDLPDNRREEVLNYVHKRYGHENVAQIITFGTLSVKQAVRDVGRVFGYTQAQLAQLAKPLSQKHYKSLDEAYEKSQVFKNILSNLPNGQLLYTAAQAIEGLPRNYSTHAAGVVIANRPLVEIVAIQAGTDGRLMTQLSKNDVEALGLLKMDFLGLRNLTLLADTLTLINEKIDISSINLNDKATLNLFSRGNTNGIFQFESDGIQNVLRRLKPDNFEMIAAVNALYRPGPMDNIDHFIKRKHKKETILFPAPQLAPILANTYGIIVYQEQVMQVAAVLAGFSLTQADILRRAISKKDANKIEKLKQDFIVGAKKLGNQGTVANEVFGYIEAFANYGFNRSHAVAYSKMAFELAYLKVHYPLAFYAALMNSTVGDYQKWQQYVQELNQLKIPILRPDINFSEDNIIIDNNALRFGFNAIKGLRSDFIKAIIDNRKKYGQYQDIGDFISRLDNRWRKVTEISPLIKIGVFDGFGFNRNELLNALPGFIEAVGLAGESLSLFATMAPKIDKLPDLSLTEKLNNEKIFLGTYVTSHPVEQYSAQFHNDHATKIVNIKTHKTATVLGYINRVKIIRTKKGESMAFLQVSDNTGEMTITVFPKLYQKIAKMLINNEVVVVNGKIEQKEQLNLIADNMHFAKKNIDQKQNIHQKQNDGKWWLKITVDKDENEIWNDLKKIIQAKDNHGDNPVVIVNASDNRKILLEKQWWLKKNNAILTSLTSLLGQGNVIFTDN